MGRFVGVRGFVVVDRKYLVEHSWVEGRAKEGSRGEVISTLPTTFPHHAVERTETAQRDCKRRTGQCEYGAQNYLRCEWCRVRIDGIGALSLGLQTVKMTPDLPSITTELRYANVGPADFIIHVHGPTLAFNMERKTNARVIVVRDARTPGEFVLCREMKVVRGDVAVVHQPKTPLSHTGNRAVSWVTVKQGVVEVRCYDDEEYMACCPQNREKMDVRSLEVLPKIVGRLQAEMVL